MIWVDNKNFRFRFLFLCVFFFFLNSVLNISSLGMQSSLWAQGYQENQASEESEEKETKTAFAQKFGEDNSILSFVPYFALPVGYVATRHKYGAGMRLGFHGIVDQVGAKHRFGVGINSGFFLFNTDGYKISILPVYPSLLLSFFKKSLFQPYIGLGGGVAVVWAQNQNQKNTGVDGMLNLFAGASIYLKSTKGISFLVETQYIVLFEKDRQGMFVNFGLGFSLNFL